MSEMFRIILLGPTAVGKSGVAEQLAQRLQTEIIVADSRQVYQGMEIGTEKPTMEARGRVPRHLIDLVPPDVSFSAGMFKRLAEGKIAEMMKREKTVFIEGGTGLYIKTLLDGLWEGPPADWAFRNRLLQEEKVEGEGTLHRRLAEADPPAAARIHPHDLPKIVRALEVYHQVGRPLSELHAAHRSEKPQMVSVSTSGFRSCLQPFPGGHNHFQKVRDRYRLIGLRRDREVLYRRIERRVEMQMGKGLVEETARLLSAGYSPELQSMRGLGYRQIIPYLQGERTLDESVALLKRDTRRYAKRQMTWFGADPRIDWVDLAPEEPPEETAERIHSDLRETGFGRNENR
ncbi:MAG: tRNA (adenosine(37)-N6)-dimethylallyltransferase MiaA [Candidatus Manganitrophaceae bacterium]